MKSKLLLISLIATGLTACAGSGAEYEPVVDGPKDAQYRQDLAQCQGLAEEKSYINGKTKTNAAIGGVLGGVVGGLGDGLGGAIAGAAVGGLIGGGTGAYDTVGEREQIVKNCMDGRGYNVLG